MSRPWLLPSGCLLLAFGSGVALGLFIGGASAVSNGTDRTTGFSALESAPGVAMQEQVHGNTLLSSRIRELEQELADQKQDQHAILADRLAFFKKYHESIRLQAFDEGDLKITSQMADILGISTEERQAVEGHLKEIQKQMEQLDDANTVIAKQTADGITYDIPPDAKGAALKDKLKEMLTSDLGEERADLFEGYGSFDSYNSPFSDFAEHKQEIEIKWMNQNGKPMYTYKQSSNNGSMWSDTPSPNVPTPLQKYLPANVAP